MTTCAAGLRLGRMYPPLTLAATAKRKPIEDTDTGRGAVVAIWTFGRAKRWRSAPGDELQSVAAVSFSPDEAGDRRGERR